MALPPKGDPRRPLHLAIRSTRVLGVILLLFGTCALMPFMMYMSRAGPRGAASAPPMWMTFMVALVYFIPGALFMVLSMFLGRRQSWAIVCALVLASLLTFFFLFAFAGFVVGVLSRSEPRAWMAIPVVLIALFGLAVGQLIYHLCKSFEAIKYPPFGQDFRGFEPLPVQRVMTAPVDPPPPASP
jgi:hypothetical protein